MLTYLFLLLFLILLRLLAGPSGPANTTAFWIGCVILAFFVAFRFEVGCDWGTYLLHYLYTTPTPDTVFTGRDPLYWLMVWAIQEFGLPFYPTANIAVTLIFFGGAGTLAGKQKDKIGFLVFLFPVLVIGLTMSALRQALAVGMVMVAFAAFIDRRFWRYAGFVIVGAGFHSSALIFFSLLPFATKLRPSYQIFMFVVMALPGLAIMGLSDTVALATSRYVGTETVAHGALFRILLLAISAGVFQVFLRKKWHLLGRSDYQILQLGSVGIVMLLPMSQVASVIADRIGYFFVPLSAMIWSGSQFIVSKGNRSTLFYAGIALHILFFCVWASLSGHFQLCYIPYQTVF